LLEDFDSGVVGRIDSQFKGDGFQELEGLGVFLFRQQVDLQIELIAPLINTAG
jgi:hypothetical protein